MFACFNNNKKVFYNIGECWTTVRGKSNIEQIPFIILDNAFKYAPEKSCINIEFYEEKYNACNVVVKSIGPKVDSDELDMIFESSYRSRNIQKFPVLNKGMGLGLSVLKQICEDNGYTLLANSYETKESRRFGKDFACFSLSIRFINCKHGEKETTA